jgi:hypothetical protein
MIIAEYVGNLWVQQPLDSINTAFNYLVSVDRNRYVEVKEFFFKNYGIEVTYATYRSTDEGVKLQLTLKEKEIDARTLFAISSNAIFGCETTYGDMGEEYSSAYILLDIDQTVEQL